MTAIQTSLWDHQNLGLSFIQERKGGMLAFDMGVGKSLITLARIVQMPPGSTILILSPKAVVPVWPKEFLKHIDRKQWLYSILPLIKGTGKRKVGKVSKLLDSTRSDFSKVVVVNYETARAASMRDMLWSIEWDLLVCDESHKLKNGTGTTSKFCEKLKAKEVILLTGTPMPHGPLDIFGQARIYDPTIFGDSEVLFRTRYAVWGVKMPPNLTEQAKMKMESLTQMQMAIASQLLDTKKFKAAKSGGMSFRESIARQLHAWLAGGRPLSTIQWRAITRGKKLNHLRKIVDYKNMDEFQAKLASFAIMVKAEDVLDLPEGRDIEVPVELTEEEQAVYDSMEKDLVSDLDHGVIAATNSLDKLGKLAQITGGACKNEDGELLHVGDSKKEALVDLFDGLPPDEPIVVFARFRSDLDRIKLAAEETEREASELSGKVNELEDWQGGQGTVIAVQIQAGGAGIDLTRACKVIYYSVSFSLGDYDQSRRRVLRPGQDRPVTYWHLAAQGTIDQRIYGLLTKRKALVEGVLSAIRVPTC